MDSLNGSPPTTTVVDDDNKKPEASASLTRCPSDQKPMCNIMLEKFRAFWKASPEEREKYIQSQCRDTYMAKSFFFYGTLTDPLRLQEVLQLPTPPVLKPARVEYSKIMLWGQYPALVDATLGSYVDGVVYFVATKQQEKMLRDYETDAYWLKGITIMVDGEEVNGRVFAWAGEEAELREGTWSLEEWKRGGGVEEERRRKWRRAFELVKRKRGHGRYLKRDLRSV